MVTDLGTVLSIAGTSLTTSYQRGTPIALQGTREVRARNSATFKTATGVTNMYFQFQGSNTGGTSDSEWDAIADSNVSTGDTEAQNTVAAVAASTVNSPMLTTVHTEYKFLAVAVKIAGTAASGDAATATLGFTDAGIGDA